MNASNIIQRLVLTAPIASRFCVQCLSLWLALPLTIWLSSGWVEMRRGWQVLYRAAQGQCMASGTARRAMPQTFAAARFLGGVDSAELKQPGGWR
jgi:hypothetical protein